MIAVLPDRTVDRDALGPVLRLVILAAATSGLRQSELLGLRWSHVDTRAQRIRVRNAWVRYEHSGEGKSDLSTRTVFSDDEDLVFAHPELGVPLDRTKVTRRFQAACQEAGVRRIPLQDLRHTLATTLAAAGVPIRTIQEYLGHADLKTTQIYAHYAPSTREVQAINEALGLPDQSSVRVGGQRSAGSDGLEELP